MAGINAHDYPAARHCSTPLPGEMLRQQFAGLLNAVDDARREFGFAEVAGHGVRELPPEFVPALRMNGFIADDGKFVRARRHKDQHPVPFRGLVHAQAHEFRLRGDDRLVNVFGADAYPDLAGGLLFGVTNGRDNIVVVQMLEKVRGCINYQLPPAPPPPKLPPPPENRHRRRKPPPPPGKTAAAPSA